MDSISILIIAIGLTMDSLAICVCQAMSRKQFTLFGSLKIALIFALFQALMPLIGYYLGYGFNDLIGNYDHWLAFIILFLVGLKMAFDSIKAKKNESECHCNEKLQEVGIKWKRVIILAFATSIDALVAGFIFVPHPQVLTNAIILIGIVCFLLTFSGMYVGSNFGKRISFNFSLLGGFILMGIGIKILLEHTVLIL